MKTLFSRKMLIPWTTDSHPNNTRCSYYKIQLYVFRYLLTSCSWQYYEYDKQNDCYDNNDYKYDADNVDDNDEEKNGVD